MSSIFNFANLLLYGVPLLCAAIVMILLISAVVLKVRTAGAKSWPQTPGAVMSALIEQQNDEGTLNYRPLIAYQYQVNGRAYQSDHLAFGRQTSWQ
jgi:Protein of unknown function (DUF3592)